MVNGGEQMNGGNMKNLVGPSGAPLYPGIVILKVPNGTNLPAQLIQGIMRITRCSIIVLPMTVELLTGKMAKDEIEGVHKAIHQILNLDAPVRGKN